jgi:hypothetical protein
MAVISTRCALTEILLRGSRPSARMAWRSAGRQVAGAG